MAKKILVLTGLPCSGKSSWCKKHYPTAPVISNDLVTQGYADKNNITYNQAFEQLCKTNFTKTRCREMFEEFTKRGDDVIIIDNTNMTVKARRQYDHTAYEKHCIIFECSDEELQARNNTRKAEGKYIPASVYEQMKKIYVEPSYKEGFVSIKTVRS